MNSKIFIAICCAIVALAALVYLSQVEDKQSRENAAFAVEHERIQRDIRSTDEMLKMYARINEKNSVPTPTPFVIRYQ